MSNAGLMESQEQQGAQMPSITPSTVKCSDHARSARRIEVALLTGGADKPYALGLASELIARKVFMDFVGSDEINAPELHQSPQVNVLNLRGDQRSNVSRWEKIARVLKYYLKLVRYVASAKPKVFHILWNNKFEFFDRTLLMQYYKLLGKRIVFTAHNVNAGKRDGNDSISNRISLKAQYRLSDHIFVHSEKMKAELAREFSVPDKKVSVIPFGINNTLPNTSLTRIEARRMLGVKNGEKVVLFFGNIAPYKGLEYLVTAFVDLARKHPDYRLIIAGRPKNCEKYWSEIQEAIVGSGLHDRINEHAEYIPDEKVEVFFKAADVLALPYNHVFQSGVLFLGYSFGLPALATDVGSMKEEIIEGKTGYVFKAKNAVALGQTIETYFASELFQTLEQRRSAIRDYANEKYSWSKVGELTQRVYQSLLVS